MMNDEWRMVNDENLITFRLFAGLRIEDNDEY